MFKSQFMWVKILKKWGGFKQGDVVRFGRTKGERIVERGEGEVVKKQQAVNDPVIETATATLPTENAMVNRKAEADAKAKAKARAEAEEKLKAEAKAKEKAEAEEKTKSKDEVKADDRSRDNRKGKSDDRRK